MHRPVLNAPIRIQRRMKRTDEKWWEDQGEWSYMKLSFSRLEEAEDAVEEMRQKCQLWEYRIPRIYCSNIWASAHAIERFRQRIAGMSTSDISELLVNCVRENLPPCIGVYRVKNEENGMILVCDFDGSRVVVVTVLNVKR